MTYVRSDGRRVIADPRDASASKKYLSSDTFCGGEESSCKHTGDVAQVEEVVELHRGWVEHLGTELVQSNCSIDKVLQGSRFLVNKIFYKHGFKVLLFRKEKSSQPRV